MLKKFLGGAIFMGLMFAGTFFFLSQVIVVDSPENHKPLKAKVIRVEETKTEEGVERVVVVETDSKVSELKETDVSYEIGETLTVYESFDRFSLTPPKGLSAAEREKFLWIISTAITIVAYSVPTLIRLAPPKE